MSAIATLSDALRPRPEAFVLSWAIISDVQVGLNTTVVFFSLFGATAADAVSASNLKLARVGTLAPGDKILVARTGSGGWVILDRVALVDELEA